MTNRQERPTVLLPNFIDKLEPLPFPSCTKHQSRDGNGFDLYYTRPGGNIDLSLRIRYDVRTIHKGWAF